ncbi:NADPH-dependent FMN reductase [Sorangium sp. So ce1128]
MRILGICGSLQARSSNLTLLHAARSMAPEGVELVLYDGIRELPLFNPDIEASGAPPAVGEWRRAIAASDALLIASPEYGHSLPGALKNAIDWVIGTGELERKVVGVTAATVSSERGRLGLQALRGTLGAVSARVVGGEPIARGPSFERELAALLDALIDAARVGSTSEP